MNTFTCKNKAAISSSQGVGRSSERVWYFVWVLSAVCSWSELYPHHLYKTLAVHWLILQTLLDWQSETLVEVELVDQELLVPIPSERNYKKNVINFGFTHTPMCARTIYSVSSVKQRSVLTVDTPGRDAQKNCADRLPKVRVNKCWCSPIQVSDVVSVHL